MILEISGREYSKVHVSVSDWEWWWLGNVEYTDDLEIEKQFN